MENSFGKDIIPGNEYARLKAVKNFGFLQGLSDQYFDKLATIIASTFNTPIALV